MILEILIAFGTLLPVVNPFSTSFVFNSLTKRDTRKHRRHLAWVAAVFAGSILLTFLLVGHGLLWFFGITVYAFRVAGGLYLGKVAFEMLSSQLRREPDQYRTGNLELAFIPLAMPLLAGPGSMTTVLALSNDASMTGLAAVAIAIVLVSLTSWVILRHSDIIGNALGPVGTNVVERILGLIVLVIAVQFIFNGVTGYLVEYGLLKGQLL